MSLKEVVCDVYDTLFGGYLRICGAQTSYDRAKMCSDQVYTLRGSITGVFFYNLYPVTAHSGVAIWKVHVADQNEYGHCKVGFILIECPLEAELVAIFRDSSKITPYNPASEKLARRLARWLIVHIGTHLSDIFASCLSTNYEFTLRKKDNVIIRRQKVEHVGEAVKPKLAFLHCDALLNWRLESNTEKTGTYPPKLESLALGLRTCDGNYWLPPQDTVKDNEVTGATIPLSDIFKKHACKLCVKSFTISLQYTYPANFNFLYVSKECPLENIGMSAFFESLYEKLYGDGRSLPAKYVMFNKYFCFRATSGAIFCPSFPFTRIKQWTSSAPVLSTEDRRKFQECTFFDDWSVLVDIATPSPFIYCMDVFLQIDTQKLATVVDSIKGKSVWPVTRLEVNSEFCKYSDSRLAVVENCATWTVDFHKLIIFLACGRRSPWLQQSAIHLPYVYKRCSEAAANHLSAIYSFVCGTLFQIARKYGLEWLSVDNCAALFVYVGYTEPDFAAMCSDFLDSFSKVVPRAEIMDNHLFFIKSLGFHDRYMAFLTHGTIYSAGCNSNIVHGTLKHWSWAYVYALREISANFEKKADPDIQVGILYGLAKKIVHERANTRFWELSENVMPCDMSLICPWLPNTHGSKYIILSNKATVSFEGLTHLCQLDYRRYFQCLLDFVTEVLSIIVPDGNETRAHPQDHSVLASLEEVTRLFTIY